MNNLNTFNGSLGLIALWFFGNDKTNIQWLYALLFLIGFDLLFGCIEAKRNNKFKYSILLDGLYRKMAMILCICISHLFDDLGMVEGVLNLQRMVTGFLLGYELTSVLNHIKIAGIPIPKILTDTLKKITESYGKIPKETEDKSE